MLLFTISVRVEQDLTVVMKDSSL